MRAPSFLLLAVIVKLSTGAVFGAPFVFKKPPRQASLDIVSKPAKPPALETERVELDVRHTALVVAEPEGAPTPPRTSTTSGSSMVKPPAVAAHPTAPPPFAVLVGARVDELPMCRGGGADGPGVAEVIFLPEGGANVKLSQPYANTETGACVARRLGRDARPFDGEPVAVRVRFSL